jgi:cell shape-determining protein MreD
VLPWSSLFVFAAIAGVIFDTFSTSTWGIHLVSFLLVLLVGWLLTKLFEIKSFWSRLLIGESMINIYFSIVFFGELIFAHFNLLGIVLMDMLINSLVYLGLLSLLNYRILYEFKKKYH